MAVEKYNSSQIVDENVNIITSSELDAFHSGAFISVSGTNTDAGTVTTGITKKSYPDILKDGIANDSIVQLYQTPSALSLISTTSNGGGIASLVSISDAITTMAWATGTVSVTTSSADLPNGQTFDVLIAGVVPVGYNGIKSITVSTAGDFTFESEDFGTVTTQGTVDYIKGATTNATTLFPVDTPFYGYVSHTNSKLIGEHRITFTDAGTFFFPLAECLTAIPVTNAQIRVAKATIAAHGLPLNKVIRVFVNGVSDPAYNGTKYATATGASTVFTSVKPSTANGAIDFTPGRSQSKFSCVVVSTSTAHGQTVDTLTNLTLSGVVPATYNRGVLASITATDQFTFVMTVNVGDATITGYVLDTDTADLARCFESFFNQGIVFGNGNLASVSVIELGTVAAISDGVDLLAAHIANEPKRFHAYCVPSISWSSAEGIVGLVETYNPLESLPVFFIQAPSSAALVKFKQKNLYCVAGFVNGNSVNKPIFEYESAIGMFQYLSTNATEQAPRGQMLHLPLIGTPYDFDSAFDSKITDFATNHVNYFSKESEGGRTGTMLRGGCLMASDDYGTPVDMLAKWSVNHFNFYGDQVMAARIMDSAADASKRLNLNDTDGQYSINDLKSTLQGFIDSEKKAKIIEDVVTINGVSEKTIALAQGYHDFKREHFEDWAAKRYSQLGANISVRGGIAALTVNVNVNFS